MPKVLSYTVGTADRLSIYISVHKNRKVYIPSVEKHLRITLIDFLAMFSIYKLIF